jgi:ketosteroid isomerase-like protein
VTAAQKAEIEKAVKEVVLQSYRIVETMDVDAAAKLWSRENFIGTLTAGRFVTNFETMVSNWRTSFANRKAHKWDLPDLTVRVFSPDTALVICSGSFRNELKNGNIANYNYSGSMILVKESSGWKIAYLAETSAARQ